MNPAPDKDARLVEGFLLGDADTLRTLDEWILPVIRHRTWGLREQEEDLHQEIRLRLLKLFEAKAFRGDSALKTYVQSTAKYTCLDAVRRARVRGVQEPLEEQIPASRDHPDEDLEHWDDARLCRLVLQGLPPVCRALFQMILERELSYDQCARELEISLGTVKSRLARCRDKAVVLRQQHLAPRGRGMS
jgi:RNA polymerase sigma-70 factor (ECF subfamily)